MRPYLLAVHNLIDGTYALAWSLTHEWDPKRPEMNESFDELEDLGLAGIDHCLSRPALEARITELCGILTAYTKDAN